MKANEFVRKFGWSKAKEVSSFTSNVCEDPTHFDSDLDIYVHFDDFKGVMDESDVCMDDLKHLVESHKLVEGCGGINVVKQHLKDGDVFRFEEKPLMKQAIVDVESCL